MGIYVVAIIMWFIQAGAEQKGNPKIANY